MNPKRLLLAIARMLPTLFFQNRVAQSSALSQLHRVQLGNRACYAIAALLLIAFSWWGVITARTGLVVRSLEREGVPMLYIAPRNAQKIPGVLVAHGYAGSKQLMLGYAHVLAQAGYAVMLWDFNSHGANAKPLERGSLQQNLDVAYAAILAQPEVDSSRLALLGHSMGSGAVMSAGIQDINRFAATIAVSPTGANVTPSAPRNLQLQAGTWEGRFVANAQRLLRTAGGENDNFAEGRGREVVVIPNAEHITILFRTMSHQAAKNWLDATFGVQRSSNYVDYRMIWYFLHLLAWLALLGAVAPVLHPSPPAVPLPACGEQRRAGVPPVEATAEEGLGVGFFSTPDKPKVHQIRSWTGLVAAPFVASGVLALLSRGGDINSLGGLLVGGAVSIWFGAAGFVWLTVMSRLPRPTLRAVGLGVGLFVVLWVAFGAMAQMVWLQWWLIPSRFQLFPLMSLACFPWFLASGVAQGVGVGRRILWWLGQSVVLVGGFILVLYLLPELGFIYLLLPLFPLIMSIFSYVASLFAEPWSYAISSALLFGWILAAAFPLAN